MSSILTNDYDPADSLVSLFEMLRCARNFTTGCQCAQEIRMHLNRHKEFKLVDVLQPDWHDNTKFYVKVPRDRAVDDEVEVYGNQDYRYRRLILRRRYYENREGWFETRDGIPIRLVDGPSIKFSWGLLFEIPESDYVQLIQLANGK